MITLPAYLNRIGITDLAALEQPPTPELLRTVVLAHTRSIAFENINALMRLPVALDLQSLESKLVRSRRGGYCFEQNALLADVLEQIGYSVERLAARVVWGASAEQPWQNPRTHMALLVSVAGNRYLCDVGFGGATPTAPLLFQTDLEQSTPHEDFRIVEHQGLYLLQVRLGDEWLDEYLFDLQGQTQLDYEMANHYVSTHPASHFRFTLMAARAFDGGRYHLRNRVLTEFRRGYEKQRRELRDAQEQISILQHQFGIDVPDEAAMRRALTNIRED